MESSVGKRVVYLRVGIELGRSAKVRNERLGIRGLRRSCIAVGCANRFSGGRAEKEAGDRKTGQPLKRRVIEKVPLLPGEVFFSWLAI